MPKPEKFIPMTDGRRTGQRSEGQRAYIERRKAARMRGLGLGPALPPRNSPAPESDAKPTSIRTKDDHAHRWRISEPNGPTSEGICKHCGRAKEFRNSFEDVDSNTPTELVLAANSRY